MSEHVFLVIFFDLIEWKVDKDMISNTSSSSTLQKIATSEINCSAMKRGKVYIFNIFQVSGESESQRDGSEKDVEELKRTFELMNAVVAEPIIDVSEADIKQKMQEIKKEDFTEYDYVTIVFSSHGYEDSTASTVVGQENIYLLKTFMIPLFKNKTLTKKLKWLIAQTCRGAYDLHTESPISDDIIFVADPRYYLISYSTSEGCLSRRSINGSIFIQSLCVELRAHNHDEDILSILKRVSDRVRKTSSEIGIDQKPSNEDNFNGHFEFSFFTNEKIEKKSPDIGAHD